VSWIWNRFILGIGRISMNTVRHHLNCMSGSHAEQSLILAMSPEQARACQEMKVCPARISRCHDGVAWMCPAGNEFAPPRAQMFTLTSSPRHSSCLDAQHGRIHDGGEDLCNHADSSCSLISETLVEEQICIMAGGIVHANIQQKNSRIQLAYIATHR